MSIYEARIAVRFKDLDAMGHVNHAVFFTYFAEGRNRLFFDFFKISDPSDFPIIMARVSCDFLKPIKLCREVVVRMRVTKIGKKSFTLGYELIDASDSGIVYAEAESVQVCYDYTENKTVAVPDDLRLELQKYADSKLFFNQEACS